jgi:hypothetical protein
MLQRFNPRSAPRASARLIAQSPKLPFDVLFHIIDEGYAAARTWQTRNHICRTYGATCRELAVYCRALLFRSVQFKLDFLPGRNLSVNVRRGTAIKHFANLVRRYPNTPMLIHNMTISLDCAMFGETRSLLDIITRRDIVRAKEALGIMRSSYPNLRVLKITGPILPTLDQRIEDAVLELILHAGSLDILMMDINLFLSPSILQYCPPTLKYLKYIGELPCFARRPRAHIQPSLQERPRLEGFAYAVQDAPSLSQPHNLLSELVRTLENTQSLKHMELWFFHGPEGLTSLLPLTHPVSVTLRCLHLLCPFAGNSMEALPSLNLGSLKALQLLEVGVPCDLLGDGLQWIANSMATISGGHADNSRDVTTIICVQHPVNWHGFTQSHYEVCFARIAKTWARACDHYCAIWTGLPQTVRTYAFAECLQVHHRTGKRIEEPRILQPSLDRSSHLRGPVGYSKLSMGHCSCYGLRERAASL